MKEMRVFENEEIGTLRTVEIGNEVWFVGKDVARILGYERESKAVVDHVDEEDRQMLDGKTQSRFGIELGQRGGWIINESGLYSLILSSKLPSAKRFKRWVTSEVLPSIRKTGHYEKPDSYMIEDKRERALRWIEEETVRIEQAEKIATLTPKAQMAEDFIESGHAVGFRDLCKELGVNERHMARIMHLIKFAYRQGKRWKPYSDTLKKGYAVVKDCFVKNMGCAIPRMYITMEGKAYLKDIIYFYRESELLSDWGKGVNDDYDF